MPDISKITLPSGTVYNLKDAQARSDIADLQSAISGGVTFIGETTTTLSDGSTTNPIVINGQNVTATKGDLVVSGSKEYVFDGTKWIELGDLSALGDLAWKDSASGSYTPAGTVSQPTFTGDPMNSSGNFTPAGSVSKPDVDVTPTSQNVTPFGSAGTLPVFTASVSGENLTLGFNAGTLPSGGTPVSVVVGVAAELHETPTFTGTQGAVSVSGTPSGTVSQPTFSGASGTVNVS